ncbi:unnamed protein product [Closterium sp. Yama58-4]|nr:unnamed protein product [Closterium sp. Yama58-4]
MLLTAMAACIFLRIPPVLLPPALAMALSSIAATSAQTTAVPRLTAAVSQDNAISAAGLVPLKQRNLRTGFLGEAVRQQAQAASRPVQAAKSAGRPATVTARTSGSQYEVEVDKPLGLTLGDKPGGGVQISGVAPGSNAAKAGIKVGDQVVYTSSFFGDELWPSDNLGFTRTAVNAKPDSVYFVLARGGYVDVKRLPKRPAPSRFGRKLTEAQKARATHICLDCGFIYTLSKPFEDQPDYYECPQCSAPKKRFARYDPETDRAIGGGSTPILSLISIVVGVAAIAAAAYYGFQ